MMQLPAFKHPSGPTFITLVRLMAKKWHKYAYVNAIFVSAPAVSIYCQPSGKCCRTNLILSKVSDSIALVTVFYILYFYILKKSNVRSINFLCYSLWALSVWSCSPFSILENISSLTVNISSYSYLFFMCARMTIFQILATLYLSSLLNFLSYFLFFILNGYLIEELLKAVF